MFPYLNISDPDFDMNNMDDVSKKITGFFASAFDAKYQSVIWHKVCSKKIGINLMKYYHVYCGARIKPDSAIAYTKINNYNLVLIDPEFSDEDKDSNISKVAVVATEGGSCIVIDKRYITANDESVSMFMAVYIIYKLIMLKDEYRLNSKISCCFDPNIDANMVMIKDIVFFLDPVAIGMTFFTLKCLGITKINLDKIKTMPQFEWIIKNSKTFTRVDGYNDDNSDTSVTKADILAYIFDDIKELSTKGEYDMNTLVYSNLLYELCEDTLMLYDEEVSKNKYNAISAIDYSIKSLWKAMPLWR